MPIASWRSHVDSVNQPHKLQHSRVDQSTVCISQLPNSGETKWSHGVCYISFIISANLKSVCSRNALCLIISCQVYRCASRSASRCLRSWEIGVLIIFEEKAGDLIMQIVPYINFLYKISTVFGLHDRGMQFVMLKQPVQQCKEPVALIASSYYSTQGCPPYESVIHWKVKQIVFERGLISTPGRH